MAGISPSEQAKRDQEKTKANPVKTFAEMSPEEREAVIAQVNSQDRVVAKRRAEQAKYGKR